MKGRIGITLGDVTGIGPEVTIKALAQWPAPDFRCLVIGDGSRLKALNDRLKLGVKLQPFESWDTPGQFFIRESAALPEKLSPGTALASEAALEWLDEGVDRCVNGELDEGGLDRQRCRRRVEQHDVRSFAIVTNDIPTVPELLLEMQQRAHAHERSVRHGRLAYDVAEHLER